MSKVGWGGARPGAGRRDTLDVFTRLGIGAECERRWHEAKMAQLRIAEDRLFARADYRSLVQRANSVPVEDRKDWLRSIEGADHAEDVEYALATMNGTDDEETPPRNYRLDPARPYAAREKIIADVAAWASKRAGRAVSARTVRTCWTLARRFAKDIKS